MNTAHSKAIFGKGFVGEVHVFFANPHTYMNLSGESGLKSELEKASPTFGRGATYLKELRIKALPRHICQAKHRLHW
ncbi:ubiquitin carboxyl-terminal hydrolase 7-like [Vigna umbellata]|uniref:ubiquitin carboxyl-terminal hydrolase 7-like n=1 Tax=Vigna umbellata TaxID=87088 RepID=UPI001F5EC043|nr:ubiquitin carboxyl-terminal hydrolase 7-like [Vigna umbellata]XP_047176311.1 ubiquitin carboxyl-terminal hydrolase 7-like [Vigna umbellata]